MFMMMLNKLSIHYIFVVVVREPFQFSEQKRKMIANRGNKLKRMIICSVFFQQKESDLFSQYYHLTFTPRMREDFFLFFFIVFA